ncbi:MAG: hypothetical protein WB471_07420 [Nocardioides sp.]
MSEPAPTLPYGPGPPPESEGSDLVRFVAVVLVGAIVLVSLFLLIRARQVNNSESNYRDCVSQAQGRDSLPGSRPEDSCQRPK